MRPRVFPAEDLERDALEARSPDASMRPRVFPAEDRLDVLLGPLSGLELQ